MTYEAQGAQAVVLLFCATLGAVQLGGWIVGAGAWLYRRLYGAVQKGFMCPECKRRAFDWMEKP